MSNLFSVSGFIATDPKVEEKNGTLMAKFTLPYKRNKNKVREGQPDTLWINVTCFGGNAKVVQQYCQKGKEVTVYGDLDVSVYHSQKADAYLPSLDLTVSSIHLNGKKSDDEGSAPNTPQTETKANTQQPASTEDVPF